MFYDVWDVETNNAVGRFETEAAALETVRILLDAYGDAYADELQFGGEDDLGRAVPAVGGEDLVALARRRDMKQPA